MSTPPKMLPSGVDLMRRINDGDLTKAPVAKVERLKQLITDNCEELIEVGARIRPLMVVDKQVGWIRGVHPQERQTLKRWVKDPNDYIFNVLLLATSLSTDELENMSAIEIRSLAEVTRRMGEYDMSLYPFLGAYVTTQSSENLWFGKGDRVTSFENKIIAMPDGKQIKIMAPPNHARVWASLCTYREQSKRRLEENFNALFIVRPWAGKSADPIQTELKGLQRQMETDAMGPWEKIAASLPGKHSKNDGWAHPGDSIEDLQRELKGMLEGDRHERVMDAWQKQLEAEAQEQRRKLEKLREERGTREPGVYQGAIEVLTDADMRARQAAMRQGKPPMPPAKRESHEVNPRDKQMEKFRKYV